MTSGDFLPLCVPSLGDAERDLLLACIDDNFVSSAGPNVGRFEADFASYVGVPHAVATTTGTAALHLAMCGLDIGPGDLVAVSDFTFIASANAVSYVGADVLLVDSESRSWNMDTQLLHDHVVDLARRGERLPKAIEVVHVLGNPADAEPLLDLRDRFDIALIEDAAEALGARFGPGRLADRSVGSVGNLGAFSFNGNKIMTTGGGGMVTTHDQQLADRIRHLTTQAKESGDTYSHDEVGFNYRMTNVAAALGLAQLGRLDDLIERKRRIAAIYDAVLEPELAGRPPASEFGDPTYWLYTITVAPHLRDVLLSDLRAADIGARAVWPPLRSQPPYRNAPCLGGGVGQAVFDSAVSVPSSVDLQDHEVERVAQTVNRILTDAIGS